MCPRLMSSRLGELLVKRGLITSAQLAQALELATDEPGALPSILTRLNALTDAELMAFFQNEYHLPFVDLAATDIPHDVIRLIPLSLAQRHQLLPTSLNGSTLTLAMADPSNFAGINEVKFLTGYDVKVTAAAPTVIAAALQRLSDQHIDYDDVLAHVSHHDVERLPCDGERQSKEIEPASEDARWCA